MQQILLFLHSTVRWLVLAGLFIAIYTGLRSYLRQKPFDKKANLIRHLTATIVHIQLIVGITLYFQSPAVKQFMATSADFSRLTEPLFFGIIHISLMILSVLIITIGSALSKRQPSDQEKFRVMLVWFVTGLIIILIAIPWPFSPLAQRPFIRL